MRLATWLALLLTLTVAVQLSLAAGTDPIFDLPQILAAPLNAKVTKTTEKDGIVMEEVLFHSEMDGDKSVDIFAFFGYPRGAEKLPAFIWNQGGLAQADTYWPTFGAKRGYATLCIDFPQGGYRSTGGYNIISSPYVTDDPTKAPIYHGAVALLRAVSFLESRKEVDKDRIGMAGSSWGGFFTTLMIGLDPRLKAGSAMFGTGNLQLGCSWFGGEMDPAKAERWRTTLDPAFRLPTKKTPIGWFTGTNDGFYWMPALMKSYEMAGGKKNLTLLPNWNHGLNPTGDEEVFTWLDVFLKGAPPFLQVSELKVEKKDKTLVATWSFTGPKERPVGSADLILSYGDAGNWSSRYWKTLPANVLEGGQCSIELPPAGMPFYIGGAAIDKQGFRYSTPLMKVDPTALGVAVSGAPLGYDGCSNWGRFEKDNVFFLQALAFWDGNVGVNTDPKNVKEGAQSAIIKGKANFHPVLFTVGVPHQFSAWLKADKEAEVTVDLAGSFGNAPKNEQKTFKVGTGWTQIKMDYAVPASAGQLAVNFTVPEGTTVFADAFTFRPVK